MRKVLVSAALALLAGASAPVSGQPLGWVQCNEINQARGTKVVITDLIGQPEHQSVLLDFQERLSVKVRAHEQRGGESAVVLCVRSRPQSHEFGPNLITSLDDQRVLAVLWGRLGSDAMIVNTVLVPYRREAIEEKRAGSRGLDRQQFPTRDGMKSAELLKLLAQEKVTELAHTYFVLGLGLRFLRNREYGSAQSFLCLAKRNFTQLEKAMGQQAPPDVRNLLDDKLKHVADFMKRGDAAAFTQNISPEECGA